MQDQLNILVVDDDEAVRRTVTRAIRTHDKDARVHEAWTCSQATEAIISREFDCVLLGTHFAGGDAMDCLADVREAGDTTPIIILASRGDEKFALDAIRAGATDYLSKDDLTPQLLKHCLRSSLRLHQSQVQIRRAHAALHLRDTAIAAASNGIVICDPQAPDCPIIYCNPAFSLITGYAAQEAVGRNCRFLQGEGTDSQDIQRLRECLRQERECQVVLRNYKKDGAVFWNELTISPVRDVQGTLTHFIGVQTDVTDRWNAEEALRVSAARQQGTLRDVLSSVTDGRLILCASSAELPKPHARFADAVPLSRTSGVRELRRHTMNACIAAGLPDERRYDLETAVGEAAMNAVVHAAAGTGHVCLDDQGTVQVWIEDEGDGIAMENLPSATLREGYSSAGTLGHGFKMILKTVDRVHLLTGTQGTTVVIEQDRAAASANA